MRQKLAARQIDRKRKRYKEKRRNRIKLALLGVLTVFAFIFIIKPHILLDNTAKADSAELLSKEFVAKKTLNSSDLVQEKVGNIKKQKEFSKEDYGFSDELKAYKILKSNAEIFKDKSIESKVSMRVKAGEYVKFYGLEEGWAKVSHKNSFGFIKSDLLSETPSKVMTVRGNVLYVDKDNLVASDYAGGFDVETENSLLIAIEAMKREGLEIGVGRKYTSFEDEKNYITNSDGGYANPDEYTSELRTGFAVEIHSVKKDPRIEDDFFDTKEGKWVKNNMHRFGFVLRYPEGKEEVTGFRSNQHIFRYVGVKDAQYMFENNLTMEEFYK